MSSKYLKLWRWMEGQRGLYALAVGALVLASCFLYLEPMVSQVVLDGVLAGDAKNASALVRSVLAWAGGTESLRAHLWVAAVAVVGLTAAAGLFTYLRGRWSGLASEAIARLVRDALYDRLQRLPCRFHDRAQTGDLVQRCTSDVETLRLFLANQIVEVGRAVFLLLLPLPVMFWLDARMTLISTLVVPPIVLSSILFFRWVQRSFKEVDEAEGRMTSTLQENLTGIRVVRAFAQQEAEKAKFDRRNSAHRALDYRMYKVEGWFWSCSDLLCMGQRGLVLAAGAYGLARGDLSVGTLFFFLAAVNLFLWPVRMLGRILSDLGKATVSIGRIGEILDHPVEEDPEEAAAEIQSARGAWEAGGAVDAGRSRGAEIVFDQVSFSHTGEGKVLEEISFRVAPGQTLALLGPSGSGKSTIVNLLLRFYDPDSGKITIEGRDLSRMSRQAVRSRIAVVMQEPFLYSKTLGENIRLGRWAAEEAEIIGAAERACVHQAVEAFGQGYGTLVGERGVTLSGGQRQRVALARALLGSQPILILDDALSAVDTDTEGQILRGLRGPGRSPTTLLIAHRLTTVMGADWILVLDRGRIIQEGTHATLAAQEGLYRRLWKIQSAWEKDVTGNLSPASAPA